jgi:sulfatase maturation enzyme AslB (radical SAM superfamily)
VIDALKPPTLSITLAFQTNGTLIDEAWCAFGVEQQIGVWVSIHGARHFVEVFWD